MQDQTFETDLKIDKFALDEEWLRQPHLYFHWAEDHTQALLERDQYKQKLEMVKANADLAIRNNPTAYLKDKVTESAISNLVTNDSNYQQALKDYQQAQYNVNILANALEALQQKRSALDNLTKLFLSGYWSQSAIPASRELTEQAIHAKQQQALSENPKLKKRR